MLEKFLVVLVFIFSLSFIAPSAYASTLYLSPGSTNIPQGSVVSVAVGLNTKGESINGVSAYLSYPSNNLEVAWISYGSSFPIAAEGTYGGGGIRISRGNISGVVGSVNVATIGFRGKTRGVAKVSFIGGSGAPRTSDSSDSLNLGGSTGGTFTVTPPGRVLSSQKSLKISNVSISLISTAAATISWTTDEKADSQVEYGLEPEKYFLSLYDKNLTTDHVLKVEGPILTPGAVFHFRVKSKNAAGDEGVSNNRSFQLKGYTVNLKILDTNNKPVSNTEVLLYSNSKSDRLQTSPSGEVSFANVTSGKHLVVVKINNNFDKTKEIDVQNVLSPQAFTLVVDTGFDKTGYFFLGSTAIVVISLVVLIILVINFLKRRQRPSINNLEQSNKS